MDIDLLSVAAVLEIARQHRDSQSTEPLRAPAVATILGLGRRALDVKFRQLRLAGIIESVRGISGGFRLAKSPKSISVREIYDAVSGDANTTRLEYDRKSVKGRVDEVFADAHRAHRDHLSRTTVADMLEFVPKQPVTPGVITR